MCPCCTHIMIKMYTLFLLLFFSCSLAEGIGWKFGICSRGKSVFSTAPEPQPHTFLRVKTYSTPSSPSPSPPHSSPASLFTPHPFTLSLLSPLLRPSLPHLLTFLPSSSLPLPPSSSLPLPHSSPLTPSHSPSFHPSLHLPLTLSLNLQLQVMLAASYWSLLAPAIEMADKSTLYGSWTFLPISLGFVAGAIFVHLADLLLPMLVSAHLLRSAAFRAMRGIWELLDLHKSKQGNTNNLNIFFSMENEKRAAQVGLEPTTYCLLGRCSTNCRGSSAGWVESRQYKERTTSLT